MNQHKPYIEVEQLEIVKQLKSNWVEIKREMNIMFSRPGTSPLPKPNWTLEPGRNKRAIVDGNETMYVGKNFTAHLRVVKELLVPSEWEITQSEGAEERRERRRKSCPVLMSLLSPMIDDVGNIGFNKLYPEAKIAPHYGVSTDYFRVHLGIETDPGCKFYIEGGNDYVWKDGEVMAFADGHWLHWVEHRGQKPRTILAVDFKKSILGPNANDLFPKRPV